MVLVNSVPFSLSVQVTGTSTMHTQTATLAINPTSPSQRRQKTHRSCLLVRAEPSLDDAREVETILVTSLRALFGEWEHHSCRIKVTRDDDRMFRVECLPTSVAAVRAAFTMVTPPAYLDSILFRFDVVEVQSIDVGRTKTGV